MNSFVRGCQLVILGAGVALSASPLSAAEIVRPATDGRVWQVNLAPTEPIRWPWETGAAFARLTITNHCRGTVSVEEVARAADDVFGAFALTVPDMPEERLYTLVLEQFHRPDAESVRRLSTETARIVYLPGIHGAGTTVRPTRGLRACEANLVFAYDADWAGGGGRSFRQVRLDKGIGRLRRTRPGRQKRL